MIITRMSLALRTICKIRSLPKQTAPRAIFRTAEKDLRDLIAACKIDDGFRGVIPFKSARLDVQISGEVQVLFDGIRAVPWTRRPLGRGETETAKQSAPR